MSASIKRALGILVGIFMLAGVLQALDPTPANAEVQSGTTVSYSKVDVTDESVVTAVVNGEVEGKITLEYIVKDGLTYKGSCPKVTKVTSKLLKTKKCFVLKSGKFVNSGRHRNGKIYYFTDYAKYTKFIKKGSSWRKATCGNYVRFKTYPSLKVTSIVMVKSLAEISVTVKVTAKASVTATATAWCKSNSSSANATASASASAEASAEATASAKSELEAKMKATGSINVTELRNKVSADVKAEAAAKATAKAEAQAVCTDTPPATPAPQILEVSTVNDVVVNNERALTVTGTVASGHTATLFASAKNGGTITANKSQTVSGNFTVDVTYKASTEAGTDQVEFTLTQDDGQKATKSTNVFNITARPTTP
jgi:hypothetical protein